MPTGRPCSSARYRRSGEPSASTSCGVKTDRCVLVLFVFEPVALGGDGKPAVEGRVRAAAANLCGIACGAADVAPVRCLIATGKPSTR